MSVHAIRGSGIHLFGVSSRRVLVRENHPQAARILEIGGGVGDLAALILRALREQPVDYTLVDIEAKNLRTARERLRNAFPNAAISPVHDGLENALETTPVAQEGSRNDVNKSIHLIRDDITDIFNKSEERLSGLADRLSFDAICGQAIMDIVPAQVITHKIETIVEE